MSGGVGIRGRIGGVGDKVIVELNGGESKRVIGMEVGVGGGLEVKGVEVVGVGEVVDEVVGEVVNEVVGVGGKVGEGGVEGDGGGGRGKEEGMEWGVGG